MVNKKLLLGLIVIGGLQNLNCAERAEQLPLKTIAKDFLPEDYGGYLESIIAGDDAALIHERNINQKLQEELDRLRQEIDVLRMEIASCKDAQNHSPMNPFTEEELEWDDSDISLKKQSLREFELEQTLEAFRQASDEQISKLVERALKAEIEVKKLQHQNARLQSEIARTQNVPGNMIPGSDSSSSDDDGDSSDDDHDDQP